MILHKKFESHCKKLQRQVNELEDAAIQPAPDGQVLSQIPLTAESLIRGLLEGEIKKWKRVCAVLATLLALALGGLLLVLLL